MASRSSETSPSRAGACPQKRNCSRQSPYSSQRCQDKGSCSNKNGSNKNGSNKNGSNKPQSSSHKKDGSPETASEQKQAPMDKPQSNRHKGNGSPETGKEVLVIDDCEGNTDSTMSGRPAVEIWFCCVCITNNEYGAVSGPWVMDHSPSCQSCGHERCTRCSADIIKGGD